MGDAKQPPTETNSDTKIIEGGTHGSCVDYLVSPARFGTYVITSTGGSIPDCLSGSYTEFSLAEAALKLYFLGEKNRTEALVSFMDPKLKEQLKKRKEERNA